jgi:CubicO group peptidase (beta-lactamase class C family)
MPLTQPGVAPGWDQVAREFARAAARDPAAGRALVIHHRGTVVVEIAGGVAKPITGRPYTVDTPQALFSATKGVAAAVLLHLYSRGDLTPGQLVTDLWPEFAACGKSATTVEMLLAHRAGLLAPDQRFGPRDLLDHALISDALARAAPRWDPGTRHGYHAVSWGYLVAEIARRATGQTLGVLLQRDVATPYGLDLWIGAPDSAITTAAPLQSASAKAPAAALSSLLLLLLRGAYWRSLTMGGAMNGIPPVDFFNRPDVLQAEIPAAGGLGSARGLAGLYALMLDALAGRATGPFEPGTVNTAVRAHSRGRDRVLLDTTRYGLGFALDGPCFPLGSPTAFGHTGIGGCIGFADPRTDLALAWTTNRFSANPVRDPLAGPVIAAAHRAARR